MLGILRTFINIILTIVEFLLALRFIFRFFEVKTSTSFVSWLYATTAPLVRPFSGIIADLNLGRFTIDFTTLIALVIYVLAGRLLLEILSRLGR